MIGLLAKLGMPTHGQILFGDQDVTEQDYLSHRKHSISSMFQNYNLIYYLMPPKNAKLVNSKVINATLHTMRLGTDARG